jgi:hypothetical protein
MNIPAGAPRRVVVASSIVGLLVVAAAIVTVSRYDNANNRGDAALAATSSAVKTGDAVTAFWQIREAAGQLAADQSQREETSQRLEDLIADLEANLAGSSTAAPAQPAPVPALRAA